MILDEVTRAIVITALLVCCNRDDDIPLQRHPGAMQANQVGDMDSNFIFVIERSATIVEVIVFIETLRVHTPVGGVSLNHVNVRHQQYWPGCWCRTAKPGNQVTFAAVLYYVDILGGEPLCSQPICKHGDSLKGLVIRGRGISLDQSFENLESKRLVLGCRFARTRNHRQAAQYEAKQPFHCPALLFFSYWTWSAWPGSSSSLPAALSRQHFWRQRPLSAQVSPQSGTWPSSRCRAYRKRLLAPLHNPSRFLYPLPPPDTICLGNYDRNLRDSSGRYSGPLCSRPGAEPAGETLLPRVQFWLLHQCLYRHRFPYSAPLERLEKPIRLPKDNPVVSVDR